MSMQSPSRSGPSQHLIKLVFLATVAKYVVIGANLQHTMCALKNLLWKAVEFFGPVWSRGWNVTYDIKPLISDPPYEAPHFRPPYQAPHIRPSISIWKRRPTISSPSYRDVQNEPPAHDINRQYRKYQNRQPTTSGPDQRYQAHRIRFSKWSSDLRYQARRLEIWNRSPTIWGPDLRYQALRVLTRRAWRYWRFKNRQYLTAEQPYQTPTYDIKPLVLDFQNEALTYAIKPFDRKYETADLPYEAPTYDIKPLVFDVQNEPPTYEIKLEDLNSQYRKY